MRGWALSEVTLARSLARLGNQAPAIALRIRQRFGRRVTTAQVRRLCRSWRISLRRGPPWGNRNASKRSSL